MIEYIVQYGIPAVIVIVALALATWSANGLVRALGRHSEVSTQRVKAVEQLTEVMDEMRTETASHVVEMQSLRNTVHSMKPIKLAELQEPQQSYATPKRKVVIQ